MAYSKSIEDIKELYVYWQAYMASNIEFWMPQTQLHGKQHCARVLMLALILGKQHQLSARELEALAMASIFHDSRRQDDWLDVGHGKRAAQYYEEYCKTHDLAFDMRSYAMIAYHDQKDIDGYEFIMQSKEMCEEDKLLYKIFKDADGLDRLRLGEEALDIKYLRTQQAKELVDFARVLLKEGPKKVLK